MTICSFVLCNTIHTDSGPAISHAINYSYESWNQHNQRNKTVSYALGKKNTKISAHTHTHEISERKMRKKKITTTPKKKKLNDPATYSNPRGIQKDVLSEFCATHSRLFHTQTLSNRAYSLYLSLKLSLFLSLSVFFGSCHHQRQQQQEALNIQMNLSTISSDLWVVECLYVCVASLNSTVLLLYTFSHYFYGSFIIFIC